MNYSASKPQAARRALPLTCAACLPVLLALLLTPPLTAHAEPSSLFLKLYWEQSVLREGREETLWLYLEDRSAATPALEISLEVPDSLMLLDGSTRLIEPPAWEQQTVFIGNYAALPATTEPYPTARVQWRLKSLTPLASQVKVNVKGDGISKALSLDAPFSKAPEQTTAPYVPAPQPVQSDRLIGMIYCPLWKPGAHYGWHILERSAPWRKPALGWYDESSPLVTDWEIKWNVEHGVDFLLYCWYRAFGNEGKPVEQMLGHAIHDGLFQARYQDHIQFCIMWTNNPYSGISSQDDLLGNLMPFWMENYFKKRNYLIIDNKPVLAIYHLQRLLEDLGTPEKVRETLGLMRDYCVRNGFDGLWILGESRHWEPPFLERMKRCGFDASFAYAWNNVPDGAPDEMARQTILSNLRKRAEWGILPDIPTVSAMWNPGLWERYLPHSKPSAHYHMKPGSFELLCKSVKDLGDELPAGSLARRILLVDNWNEWGEGHYLAPCREHGFAYLDALRNVFSDAPREHTDLTPADAGPEVPETAYRAWLSNMRESHETPVRAGE